MTAAAHNQPPAPATLFDRMELAASKPRRPKVQINRSQGGSRARGAAGGEDKWTVDQPMQFEIFGEDHPEVLADKRKADDVLVQQLKREVNSAGICRRNLYDFIGSEDEGGLFENENQAYNLEYGLRQRPTITMECVRRWLTILDRQIVTVIQRDEGGWLTSLLQLREAVLEAKPSEELVALAEAGDPGDNGYCQG
jgi:hypothetical protein